MEQQEGLNLEEMLQALRRRMRLIAMVFVISSVLGLLLAYLLPPVYSSTAKILVESQQIPQDLARSTVSAPAAERLELIEQRLMTRQNLLEIASQLGLFADRPNLTPTEKVEAMREATSIEPITIAMDRRSPNLAAFTISYRANNPGQAAAVANEFVTRILEQNLQQRSIRATETNSFFKAQIDRLQKEIAEIERRISRFKEENKNRLPDAQEFRQEQLLALQERRFEREKRRIELEEQKRLLAEQLAYGGPFDRRSLSPEEQELERLRQVIAQRRAILAETHPEIRALSARIAALERVVQPASVTTDDTGQSLTERRLTRQIELVDNQLDLLAQQDEADQARQGELEAAIEAAPAVELALSGLYRRYQDLQKQREIAVMKQAEAETGERLEVNRQAERFEVIEQAERPTEPDAPNRPLIAAGGVGGGLALGLALAFFAEMMNRAIHSPLELERRTGLRPVVTVPLIVTAADLRRRRRRRVLAVLAVVFGVPLLLGVVDRQVMPLPILADKIMTNSGLDAFVRSIGQRFGD